MSCPIVDLSAASMECCDISNALKSVQVRKLENGKYQMRESEENEWQDCEIEFDESGNFASLSYVIKTVRWL